MKFLRPNLESIIGDELSAVCFVRDYVELHFDGPILRLLGKISFRRDADYEYIHSGAGVNCFSDLLCQNIGCRLVRVDCDYSKKIELSFEGGGSIRVIGTNPGEEFAHYISFPDKHIQVWEVE